MILIKEVIILVLIFKITHCVQYPCNCDFPDDPIDIIFENTILGGRKNPYDKETLD